MSTVTDISYDGRHIAFESFATNLVPDDANMATIDAFVYDRDPDGNGIFDEGNGRPVMMYRRS